MYTLGPINYGPPVIDHDLSYLPVPCATKGFQRLTWVGLFVEVVADRRNHPELDHLGDDQPVRLRSALTHVKEDPRGLAPAQGVALFKLGNDAVRGRGKGGRGGEGETHTKHDEKRGLYTP